MPLARRMKGFIFTTEAVLVATLVGSLTVFTIMLLVSNTVVLQPRGVSCSQPAIVYIAFSSLDRPGLDVYTAATGINTILTCSVDIRGYVFTRDGILVSSGRASIGKLAPGVPALATCIFSVKLDRDNPLMRVPDEKLYCYYLKASSR